MNTDLAAKLLSGDVVGGQILCPGPGHSPHDRSLSVCIDPSAPEGFVVHSFAGDDFRVCRDHVRQRLGLPAAVPVSHPLGGGDTGQLAAGHKTARQPVLRVVPTRADRSRIEAAERIWRGATEIRGSIAETYLQSRGLALTNSVLESDALRFTPNCPFGKGQRSPAMVALMRDIKTNEPVGVHRTAMTPDGRKLDRKMLGKAGGACVKLFANEMVEQGLGIAEGIETSLGIIKIGWAPVWACLSAGTLANFPVLNGIDALTVFADNDNAGRNAALKCVHRWQEAGREARIWVPKVDGQDFAEVAA